MRDEDHFVDEEIREDEEYEMDDELEPEMQGWVQGWKKAGRYDKKEKHSEEEFEDFDGKY